jgi:integrase
MKRHLNEMIIRNLPHSEGASIDVWDITLPRFGVRIGKKRKTYICNIRNTRVALGVFPHTPFKDARNKARQALFAKYQPEMRMRVLGARDQYLEALRREKAPNTLKAYTTYLERLPDAPLHQLTTARLYEALPKGTSAANLCFAVFKAFFSWCMDRGYVETHPLLRKKRPHKLKSRDRLLSDAEIVAIWKGSYTHEVGVLFRALIVSGQRISQFQHFDISLVHGDTITWPASLMKNRQEHSLPLTPLLKEHLPTQHIHSKQIEGLKTLVNIPNFRPHDFRRYLSSTMSALKVPIDITEAILAHTSGSRSAIQRTYDRDRRIPQMREALELYEAHLQRILEPK